MKSYEIKGDFWKRISSARAINSLTQRELAELAGVSQRQIAAYESGGTWPREAVLLRLAAALGTSPEWLASGEGDGRIKARVSPADVTRKIPILRKDEIFEWLTSVGNEKFAPRTYPISFEVSNLAFALVNDDEGMASSDDFGYGFPKGCIVVFEPMIEVEDQDFVLAMMDTGAVSFRQFFSGFRTSKLHPLDNRYLDEEISNKEIESKEITLIPAVSMENRLPAMSRIEVANVNLQVLQKADYPSPNSMLEGKDKKN
ncbi:XRE family transcriptional regulator [Pantoea sp. SGAir0180]|uniref:helix-turn-helix domain-containing protein n=1 Tax=Pantoea ananas TaxID=553 RepID=UPI00099DA260|nr:helix-turn-helix transcriptional regulator [Pantoea ananatis]SKA79372.1 Transcriptional regulator, contains XRE-family HTH domain [Pantoea ananatis]